jgi:putative FmdB family regulatory protein
MPTYEYACRNCGEQFEIVQAFSDDPLTVCPKCGSELRKIFGSVGIVFKGSGFYKTDSRSAKTAVTPSSNESEPKKESTVGSESAPAAAPAGSAPAAAPTPTGTSTTSSATPAPTPAPST